MELVLNRFGAVLLLAVLAMATVRYLGIKHAEQQVRNFVIRSSHIIQLMTDQDINAAKTAVDALVMEFPEESAAYTWCGMVYSDAAYVFGELESVPRALDCYDYSLSLDPLSFTSWHGLFYTLVNYQQDDKVVSYFSRYITDVSEHIDWRDSFSLLRLLNPAFVRVGRRAELEAYCQRLVLTSGSFALDCDRFTRDIAADFDLSSN